MNRYAENKGQNGADKPAIGPAARQRKPWPRPRSRLLPLLITFFIFLASGASRPRADKDEKTVIATTGSAPIHRNNVPLTQALETLAVNAEQGYVIFGVEVYREGGSEPTVDLDVPPTASLEGALREVFRQLPEYKFETLSNHFVSVCPRAAIADRADPLNIKVGRFDVENQRAGIVLTWPERFIPELREKNVEASPQGRRMHHIDMYVGPVAGGPVVTLHLRHLTVRQILTAVSMATEEATPLESPVGWVYSPPPKGAPGGGVEYWRLFVTLPHNWLEQRQRTLQGTP